MSERDELIDCLRYRPVATTAAQMREAADLLERDGAEIARWQQVWDNVQLDVPDLRDDNKPLAVACSYELTKRERDAARAEADALRRQSGMEAELLRKELDEVSPIKKCARCGKQDRQHRMRIEEGEEWACLTCWYRCHAEDRAAWITRQEGAT